MLREVLGFGPIGSPLANPLSPTYDDTILETIAITGNTELHAFLSFAAYLHTEVVLTLVFVRRNVMPISPA